MSTPAAQGLHDDDAEAFRGGVLEAPRPGRGLGIQEVELDLAEIPGVGIDDFLKIGQVAMEGESDLPRAAIGLASIQEAGRAERLHALPVLAEEAMEQVVVDPIGPEALQLAGQDGVHVFSSLDRAGRELGGQPDPIAQGSLEQLSQEGLALSHVVGQGGIEVIGSALGLSIFPPFSGRRMQP